MHDGLWVADLAGKTGCLRQQSGRPTSPESATATNFRSAPSGLTLAVHGREPGRFSVRHRHGHRRASSRRAFRLRRRPTCRSRPSSAKNALDQTSGCTNSTPNERNSRANEGSSRSKAMSSAAQRTQRGSPSGPNRRGAAIRRDGAPGTRDLRRQAEQERQSELDKLREESRRAEESRVKLHEELEENRREIAAQRSELEADRSASRRNERLSTKSSKSLAAAQKRLDDVAQAEQQLALAQAELEQVRQDAEQERQRLEGARTRLRTITPPGRGGFHSSSNRNERTCKLLRHKSSQTRTQLERERTEPDATERRLACGATRSRSTSRDAAGGRISAHAPGRSA